MPLCGLITVMLREKLNYLPCSMLTTLSPYSHILLSAAIIQ